MSTVPFIFRLENLTSPICLFIAYVHTLQHSRLLHREITLVVSFESLVIDQMCKRHTSFMISSSVWACSLLCHKQTMSTIIL